MVSEELRGTFDLYRCVEHTSSKRTEQAATIMHRACLDDVFRHNLLLLQAELTNIAMALE